MTSFDTPALILGYNRPELLSRVLERAVGAGVSRIYVSLDGPQESDSTSQILVEQCAEAARLIVPRDRLILRSNKDHLGCKMGVASGISWFFDEEAEGIILEDDTFPSFSFFRYAGELLERYRFESRVMKVSGFNLMAGKVTYPGDYWFSNISFSWGWATWRRAWNHYDINMSHWDSMRKFHLMEYPTFDRASRRVFSSARRGADTWDYQWDYSIACQNGLHIVPRQNLIRNIGFGPSATHTKIDLTGRSRIAETEIEFPLNHGLPVMVPNSRYHKLLRRKQSVDRWVGQIGRLRRLS